MTTQTIIILMVRTIVPPTSGTTTGILLDVTRVVTCTVDVCGAVDLSAVVILYSARKLVSVPGTVPLNFAVGII